MKTVVEHQLLPNQPGIFQDFEQTNPSGITLNTIMAPAATEEIKLVTKHLTADMSETPSPDGPLFAAPSSRSSSISPATWLKLNSSAPVNVKVEEIPTMPHDEPFTGAKKLRHLLENTGELVVCPGVYDGLSARTAIELGFKSLYMVRPVQTDIKNSSHNSELLNLHLLICGYDCRLVPAQQPLALASLTSPSPNLPTCETTQT